MTTPSQRTTFVEPTYRRTSVAGKFSGVQFYTYHTGFMTTAWIGDDGRIKVWCGNEHRIERLSYKPTYFASVIGHGEVMGERGTVKRFRSPAGACREAVAAYKALKS